MSTKKPPPDPTTPRWVRNAALARYLNISAMCLWRWQRDESLGFPQPSKVGKTSYTDLNDVDAWMKKRIVAKVA